MPTMRAVAAAPVRNALVAAGMVAALLVAIAAPAFAATTVPSAVNSPGSNPSGISTLRAIGEFGGIPAAIILLVFLAVFGPSWLEKVKAGNAERKSR